jgi:hypothetical protein
MVDSHSQIASEALAGAAGGYRYSYAYAWRFS